MIREMSWPSLAEVTSLVKNIAGLSLSEAKKKAMQIMENLAEITLLAETTMKTKFPTMYSDRVDFSAYLHDEVNTLDRKDWIAYLSGNYDYTGPSE